MRKVPRCNCPLFSFDLSFISALPIMFNLNLYFYGDFDMGTVDIIATEITFWEFPPRFASYHYTVEDKALVKIY